MVGRRLCCSGADEPRCSGSALDRNAESAFVWLRLAHMYESLDEVEPAIRAYTASIELFADPLVISARGGAYLRAGRRDLAMEDQQRLEALGSPLATSLAREIAEH